MNKFIVLCALFALTACSERSVSTDQQETSSAPAKTMESSPPSTLDQVINSQPAETQARYPYRHPKETLEFFDIKPGMTVMEVLPGGGWYSKILLAYLGKEGHLIGVDYAMDMWPHFDWPTEKFLQERQQWAGMWTSDAKQWAGNDGAEVSAFTFNTLSEELSESTDAVLFIRALHNLARFENKGNYLSKAIQETKRVLKSGGIVGIVQHQAPEDKSDSWADGSRGYLKRDFVISQFEQAGFEYLKETNINKNAKDQPGEKDIVWRLPPSLSTSKDNDELREKYLQIGESNRMTLKFRKP